MIKKIIIILAIVIILAGVYFVANSMNGKKNGANPVSGGVASSENGNRPVNENNPGNNDGKAGNSSNKVIVGPGFNFIFKYGVGGKNVLDTYENKFTKDMVADPSVAVDFVLTAAEKESIRQKINELDILNIDGKVSTGIDMQVTPCSSYYLMVQNNDLKLAYNDLAKEISWDNCSGEIKEAFNQFSDFMINLIESKKEFKDLPEAQGGYL